MSLILKPPKHRPLYSLRLAFSISFHPPLAAFVQAEKGRNVSPAPGMEAWPDAGELANH
jgi:hypothetical protein